MKSEIIQRVILDIETNCNLSKRSVEDVVLIGASKSQTVKKIIEAYEEGIKNFGENYLQEAEEKINQYNKNPSKEMKELRDFFISLLKSEPV